MGSNPDGWWNIPAEVAKNGLAHRVPLAPQAQLVLDAIRPLSVDTGWVFPGAGAGGIGSLSTKPINSFATAPG